MRRCLDIAVLVGIGLGLVLLCAVYGTEAIDP